MHVWDHLGRGLLHAARLVSRTTAGRYPVPRLHAEMGAAAGRGTMADLKTRLDRALQIADRKTAPRSTPPGFFDVSSDAPVGEILQPVDPKVPAASPESRELCRAWGDALKEFPTTQGCLVGGRGHRPRNGIAGGARSDRRAHAGLHGRRPHGPADAVEDRGRLRALPFASAAHIAGAWAVLASKQSRWEEARRMQAEAGRWVTQGFRRGGR